jgi:hypothetical protein
MFIIAEPGSFVWVLVLGLLAGSLLAWFKARRLLRASEDLCRGATERHQLLLRENDVAQSVNKISEVLRHQQVALQQLHVAQSSTHGAVSHLIQHMSARSQAEDMPPKGVILLTLFGAPFRGDA